MENFFIDLLNISITASYIIIAVILFRAVFRKVPRKFICALWAIAGIRLIMPFSFESIFSLIPSTETIPPNIITRHDAEINSGINLIDIPVNDYLGDRYYEGVTVETGFKEKLMAVVSILWVVGIVAILLYGIFSYLRLKKTVSTAVLLRDNVWQSENVFSPFILGFVNPKIYIPFGLNDETVSYVTAHENAHLKRRDHWIKPLGFLLLSVYWFNPLIWVAYALLCRDIEAACDEKVISQMNNQARQEYASALLDCAVNRRKIAVCPLAFGEVGVKERIKGVMNYKKPAFWVIIFAIAACVVAAVCFLTSPAKRPSEYYGMGYILKAEVQFYEGTTQLPARTERFTIEPYENNKATISGFTAFEVAQTDLQTGEVTLEFNDAVYFGDNQTDTLKVNLGKTETVWLGDRNTAVLFTFEKTQTMEEAISAAILEHNKDRYMKGTFACESHQTLHHIDEEEYDEKTDTRTFSFTSYLVASYSEYVCFGGEPESVGGGTGPIALTFEYDFNEGKYNHVEYWEAEDGRYYVSSIEDKFPWQAAARVLNDDSIAKNLNADCDKQAQAYFAGASEKAFAFCDIPGISVVVKEVVTDVDMPYISYEVFNDTEKEISYNIGYNLYRYENGNWIQLGLIVFNLWNMTDNSGIRINPDESKVVNYGFDKNHIMEDGHYRFETKIKSHTASPAVEGTISIDFSIGDTRIYPEISEEELTTIAVVADEKLEYVSHFSYVNYVENGTDILLENAEIPIYTRYDGVDHVSCALFETKEGFDKFYNATSDIFTYNQMHDEMPSFNQTKAAYTKEFFDKNYLIIIYIPEGSGSVRHETEFVEMINGNEVYISVKRTGPEVRTMDMAGWFATIEISKNEIKHIDNVTARVGEMQIIYESSTASKKTDGSVTYTFTASKADYKKPYLNLKQDGSFYFFTSPLNSHEYNGVYSWENSRLILESEDGNMFVFTENGGNLVFDENNSSPLPTYTNSENKVLTSGIVNGSAFEKK